MKNFFCKKIESGDIKIFFNILTNFSFVSQQGDIEIIKALLVLGSDPSLLDDSGKIPFEYIEETSPIYQDVKELFEMFQYNKKGIFGG